MTARGRPTNVRDELAPFIVPDVRLTGRELGVGAYGSVEEAEIRGAVCVAKKLHEALLPPPTEAHGAERMIATFVAECRLMSVLRHPHIVQFLGVCFWPGSRVPALLMEKLLTDLHGFLATNSEIPVTLKREMLIDVAKGLSYLHSRDPPVIHRDLTARNVLLNSAMVAKIADLGNSRIINVRPGQLMTMTKTPGNMYYMPPEAQEDHSRYNKAIDTFSFGNLTLFTLTQVFPEVKAATFTNQTTRSVIARTEIQRRSESFNRLSQVLGRQHPLVQLAESCLQNDPRDRPTIATVLQRLESCLLLPYRSWGGNKLEMVADIVGKERVIATQQVQIYTQQQQIGEAQTEVQSLQEAKQVGDEMIASQRGQIEAKQRQNETLVQSIETQRREIFEFEELKREQQLQNERLESEVLSLNQISAAKELTIKQKHEEITHVQRCCERQSQTQLADKQRQIDNLHTQIDSEKAAHETQVSALEAEVAAVREQTSSQLQAQGEELVRQHKLVTSLEAQLRALTALSAQVKQQKTLQLPTSFEWRECRDLPIRVIGATTVVMNGKVYLGYDRHVLEYTPENDEWVELPKPPVEDFSLAVLNNQLVLVGGQEPSTGKRTNKRTVFNPSTHQWVHPYPPMATARSRPTAIAYQHYLIVAGGEEDRNKLTSDSVVEIFDSVKEHWYTAEELPIKCAYMTPVVISNTAYLLGGYIDGKRTKTVLTVSLPALINKATSQSQEVNTPTSWKVLPDSPLKSSAPFTSHNMLLTAGGFDDSMEDSSHIYCYDPVTSQWEKVGDLPKPRYVCSCTVLPSTELLVVGGWPRSNFNSVCKATIQWK